MLYTFHIVEMLGVLEKGPWSTCPFCLFPRKCCDVVTGNTNSIAQGYLPLGGKKEEF